MRDPLFALSSFSVFNLWGLSHTTGMTQVKWPQVVKGLLSNKFGMEWIELCYHLGDSALVQNETTYSFAFLGTDNIPWKPIETVMHHISTDPASISTAWVTLSCKSIDELLREQIDFWGESKEKKKTAIPDEGLICLEIWVIKIQYEKPASSRRRCSRQAALIYLRARWNFLCKW